MSEVEVIKGRGELGRDGKNRSRQSCLSLGDNDVASTQRRRNVSDELRLGTGHGFGFSRGKTHLGWYSWEYDSKCYLTESKVRVTQSGVVHISF